MEMDRFAKREVCGFAVLFLHGDVVSSYPYPVDAPRVVREFFFSSGEVCVFLGDGSCGMVWR